jgi:hypothetical protein
LAAGVDRDRIIERIRKLRERGRGVGAEAITARNLTRTLMREHGISADDLKPPAKIRGPRPPGPPSPLGDFLRDAQRRPVTVQIKVGPVDLKFEL